MEMLFYRYGSICEPDLIDTFSAFGLKVFCVDNEISDKKITAGERLRLLEECVKAHTFSFIFSINFFPSISDFCKIYKIPYVCWSVDSPVMELFNHSVLNECNRIFLFDKAQYRLLSEYCPNHVFHLPLATNVKRWDHIISQISAADRARFSCDISMVASLYSEKDPYLLTLDKEPILSDHVKGFVDGLIKAQSQIYGYHLMEGTLTEEIISVFKNKMAPLYYDESTTIFNTDRYVTAHQVIGMHAAYVERIELLSALAQTNKVDLYTLSNTDEFKDMPNLSVRGSAKTLTEMPKIFHLSKINLNITIRPIQAGLSLRIWDVLGCGGFLITNYQEELTDHFTPGVELETFASKEELLDKCEYYLTHEEERLKIAKAGYEKVKANHTYQNRVADLIKIVYHSLMNESK